LGGKTQKGAHIFINIAGATPQVLQGRCLGKDELSAMGDQNINVRTS
jgi:hypothetical protein